jgi:outer membrane usher protein
MSVTRSTPGNGKPVTEAFAGLSVYLGSRTTATMSYQRQGNNQNVGAVDVQRSLPVGPGFGYRAQVDTTGDTANGGALLQYQGPWGRYEASYFRANGTNNSLLSVAGGVAAIDGTVFATRPLTDSFAVIRVPGVEGVRGYLNNQEVGRTNSRGDLPVPDLLAYYGNRLGIADQDIPLDHSVGATERTVATPFRGGAVVAFPVRRVQAVTGTVTLEIGGAAVVPAYGQLVVSVDGHRFESPIGADGEYYLENLPVGRHIAVVEHEAARCSLTLDVPAGGGAVMTLSPLRCVVP